MFPETARRGFKIVVLALKVILLEKTSFSFSKFLVSIFESYSSTFNSYQTYVILKISLVLNLHFLKQNPCLDRDNLTLLCIL